MLRPPAHSGYNAPASHPEEKQNGRNTSVCQLKYHTHTHTQTINYTHAQICYIQKQINMDISAHLPDCVCEKRVYSHTHSYTKRHIYIHTHTPVIHTQVHRNKSGCLAGHHCFKFRPTFHNSGCLMWHLFQWARGEGK